MKLLMALTLFMPTYAFADYYSFVCSADMTEDLMSKYNEGEITDLPVEISIAIAPGYYLEVGGKERKISSVLPQLDLLGAKFGVGDVLWADGFILLENADEFDNQVAYFVTSKSQCTDSIEPVTLHVGVYNNNMFEIEKTMGCHCTSD